MKQLYTVFVLTASLISCSASSQLHNELGGLGNVMNNALPGINQNIRGAKLNADSSDSSETTESETANPESTNSESTSPRTKKHNRYWSFLNRLGLKDKSATQRTSSSNGDMGNKRDESDSLNVEDFRMDNQEVPKIAVGGSGGRVVVAVMVW
ncbi:hypothetical protein AX774_g357 [Zancudomyces culisetae]|uniref:Uncharacterized protein n=1 Tax=Zancudomyces culisetae TaxID=1213189 RepID=A0A1R1PYS4_ZANCU|nr:hypothetical protein AX774_g357 [Zancudomyces culisetae]|eukprot:OMH86079.1 hypothetical protein AX774_g357 [Zancudomyces culisetae]